MLSWSLPSSPLPQLLAFNGGYVDTAGFLALQGLFTAHVTGNFVTFGAALVQGSDGALAKLLVLPVFCAVVLLTRLLGYVLARRGHAVLRPLLGIKLVLLVVAAVLAVLLLPDGADEGWAVLVTAMTLVTAMALQNGLHRGHLASSPPSTLMTGTTTQVMIDLADLLHGLPADEAVATRGRLRRNAAQIAVFALGCGIAALLYASVGPWCFVLPALVALWAFTVGAGPVAA